jgi:hypothetical protein
MRRLVFPVTLLAILSAFACGSRTELLGEFGGGLWNGTGSNPNDSGSNDGLDGSNGDDASRFLPDGALKDVVTPPNPCGGYQAYAPWPAFQRCSEHVGRTDAKGPTRPAVKWHSVVGDVQLEEPGVLGPPTIAADGTIYLANLFGEVLAFGPDGTQRWLTHATYVQAGPSAVAVGANGLLYVELDQLYALAADGSLQWFAPIVPGVGVGTLGPTTSSVTLNQDGNLYLGTQRGLLSIDAHGGINWIASTLEQGWTPAVAPSGTIYSANLTGRLLASNADGTTVWTFDVPDSGTSNSWIQTAPVIADDGTIYFGAITGFYAFKSNGEVEWQIPWATTPTPGAGTSLAIGADGTIYLIAPDSTLRAISPKGKQIWSLPIGTPGSPPVVDGSGVIYFLAGGSDGGPDQSLFAVTSKGTVEWELALGIVRGGGLAVGSDGTIYAATVPEDILYAVGNAQ